MAQQLLKKVLIYEENNKALKEEKQLILRSRIKDSSIISEQINLLYSIAGDLLTE